MDPITRRNRSRTAGPDIYWRRRLFALAAGLAVFGLLAWAVGGASTHPMASTTSISTKSPHTNPPPSTLPVTPSPSPSSSSPSPSPSASSSSPGGPHSKSKHQQAASASKDSHRKSGGTALGDDCPSADVVVSLTANGNSYAPAARPKFTVTVVSTDGRRCAFNIGPRYLALVIHSGSVRAWGSGDCVHGTGTQVAMLRRGVPVQQKITWDRTLSAPGCRPPHRPAQPGTYTVTASDSGVRSHTLVFVLR